MSDKKLTILGIVAVLMVILAVVQSNITRKRALPETLEAVYIIQGLDPEDIGSIVISAGEDTVTLNRKGKRFVIAEKNDYPAKINEVNRLISSCMDIKREVKPYTTNTANHKDLEVAEENAKNIIKFLKPDFEMLVGLVIGKDREQGQGAFVRLISDDEVYVTPKVPWINAGSSNYIEQKIVELKREDIEEVTVVSPKASYTLKADKEGNIVLENLPEGKKLKDYDQVFNALSSLSFDDVVRRSKLRKELTFDNKFICRLKDSTIYTIEIAKKDNKNYIICDAKFTDETPITKEKSVESEEELIKKEAKLLARDAAQHFSMIHRNWIYEIPEHKIKTLTTKLEDLLQDKEEPKKPDVPPAESTKAPAKPQPKPQPKKPE
ncbi:MAG: DUF4340 domain-containing protein [Planctomycetota bacterium]|jgi:hypothetical protein